MRPGYANIGGWATAIPASTGLPHQPPAAQNLLEVAPAAGRVCSTGLAISPQVTETLVTYDDASRSLTYEAAGMPSFVTTARNTWTVTLLDNDSCVVNLDTPFDTRGIVGTLARWAMLAQLGRTANISATTFATSSNTAPCARADNSNCSERAVATASCN